MKTKLILLFVCLFPIISNGQGVSLVKNIDTTSGCTMLEGTSYNNRFYFINKQPGRSFDLWQTDGYNTNTTLIAHIQGLLMSGLTAFNNKMFFCVKDTTSNQLWSSNGTSTGTVAIKKFQGRFAYSSRFLSDNAIQVVNGRIFFVAEDSLHGEEIFTSDGTDTGTHVLDINPGPGNGTWLDLTHNNYTANFAVLNNKLYFSGNSSTTNEATGGLWVTDGTMAGTQLVYGGSRLSDLIVHNNKIYFNMGTKGFAVSDGTAAGTTILDSSLNSHVFVDTIGSLPIILPTVSNVYTRDYTILNNELYFVGFKDTVCGLYATDGTRAGTRLVKDSLTCSISAAAGRTAYNDRTIFLTTFNSAIYFQSNGLLWRSDGTPGGTMPFLSGTFPGNPGYPVYVTQAFGRLLFKIQNSQSIELWSSNGTAIGIVKHAYAGGTTTAVVDAAKRNTKFFTWGNKVLFKNTYTNSMLTPLASLYRLDLTPNSISGINSLEDHIIVYPNPSAGIVHVRLKHPYESVMITDQIGRTITKEKIGAGKTDFQFDLDKLSNGIYYLQLSGNGNTIIRKVVLQR